MIKKTIIEQAKNLAASNEAVNHLADKKVAARELREEFQKNKGQVSVSPSSWRECRCALLNTEFLNAECHHFCCDCGMQLEDQTARIMEIEIELTPVLERVDSLQSVFTKIRDLDTRLTEVTTSSFWMKIAACVLRHVPVVTRLLTW